MKRIRTIQTRDCYYPIYEESADSSFYNPDEFLAGFYFYDEELADTRTIDDPSPYVGPFSTLDECCKTAHKWYTSIMML